MIVKMRARYTNTKSQALTIVVFLIALLSAFFLFNIIKYNKKEIEDITNTYDKLIKRSYNVSQIHMAHPYQLALQQFLSSKKLKEAINEKNHKALYNLTFSFFSSLKKRFASVQKINWYSEGSKLILSLSPTKKDVSVPAGINPPVREVINSKKEYKGFFTSGKGIGFRLITPVFSHESHSPSGAIELIVNAANFLETIEQLLGLKIALVKTIDDNHRVERTSHQNPNWKKIKGGYYYKNTNFSNNLFQVMDQLNANAIDREFFFNKRIYKIYSHLDMLNYQGNPTAKIISLQDITLLKRKINHSILLIIFLSGVILGIVFIILVLSFNKLMKRLVEREKQLEITNEELESEIKERKEIENELTTHRVHLEELISEGIRELEIKSQEIETNEKKLRTITSSIQDAIIMQDDHGNIIFWNPAAERMFGFTATELKGRNFFQYFLPINYYKQILEMLGQQTIEKASQTNNLANGRIIEVEFKDKFGKIFPAELMISKVEIHEKPHLVALIRDITQKKAEETEKRILLCSVEQSSVGIEITGTDGKIQYVNPKFTEITGYKKEEVIGKSANILKSDFTSEEIYKDLWLTISSGKDWHGELYNMKKNGTLYWDSTLISPIKDVEGKITHFVAIKEDITERKNFEDELRSAKESAEAASRSKGEFLANMSHEIRTPMNAIIGMTELALGTNLNEEQKEYLEIVQHASSSLLKLLNDILDFSKVEAGKLVLEPSPFNLRKLLGETTRTLAIQTFEKDLELIYYIDQGVPNNVIGDAGRLRQIIVNLIGNSIKFTDKGEIVLKIEVLEDGIEDKVLLHITVSDTGIGIPQELVSTIFEKFSQADSSTTRKYGGTGLGLTISSKLVELMGGIIWAESPSTFPHSKSYGPGSTFHFTILLEKCNDFTEPMTDLEIQKLEGLKILIIDDNSTSRQFLKELLAKKGLKPDTASSGREAIEILHSKPKSPSYYQLIILDFKMPDMDGRTVLKEIRLNLQLKIPVILLISGVLPDDISQLKQRENTCHLIKPINSQELLETMLDVFGYKIAEETPELGTQPEALFQEDVKNNALRLLVAEDNIINQRLIRRLLEKNGHHVEIVPDGQKAVEAFIREAGNPERKFHVILMDIQMPGMDGIAATREIRKIDPQIPIIALTAHAMKGDKGRFLAEGMDDYISKPIERSLLFDIIAKYGRNKT